MSYYQEILNVTIVVRKSDGSQATISDPKEALEILQLLATGIPPRQPQPLSLYRMNTDKVRALVRSVFSKAGWKWGGEGLNNPLYDVTFDISDFTLATREALLNCSIKNTVKISDIVDVLLDPSKNQKKKELYRKLSNRALNVLVIECVLCMHGLNTENFIEWGLQELDQGTNKEQKREPEQKQEKVEEQEQKDKDKDQENEKEKEKEPELEMENLLECAGEWDNDLTESQLNNTR